MAAASSARNVRLDSSRSLARVRPDQAWQQPRQPVLGREVELAVGGGELGALGGEAQIAVAGQHQAHPGGRSVDGGDDRFGQPEVEGEVVIELRRDPVARPGQVVGRAGVVAASVDVARQGLGVRTGAEPPPFTGHHHHPHRVVGLGPAERGPVLGVHPPGPGVEAVRPGQGDGGDPIVDLVAEGPQLGAIHPVARSGFERGEGLERGPGQLGSADQQVGQVRVGVVVAHRRAVEPRARAALPPRPPPPARTSPTRTGRPSGRRRRPRPAPRPWPWPRPTPARPAQRPGARPTRSRRPAAAID